MMEPLEARQLLSGTTGTSPNDGLALAATSVNVRINFQHVQTPHVPPGYRADIGREYGRRANRLTYGWSASNEHRARDRGAAPDDRYDTLNHLASDSWWAIALPDGVYDVRLVSGDPNYFGDRFQINVEGTRIIDGSPTADGRWLEGHARVRVTDGALTVTSGPQATNNKLSFIEIRTARSGGTPASDLSVRWTNDGNARAPIGRVDQGAVQVGHKLYLFGGYSSVDLDVTNRLDIFDMKRERWTSGAPLPDGAAQTHGGVTTDGRYVYLVSGQVGPRYSEATTSSWRYDPVADAWDNYVPLPEARFGGALVHYNGILYFFGGTEADRHTVSTSHWALNTRSRNPSWVERAPLPMGGDHLAAREVNGTIYAIGGEHGHTGLNNDPEGTYAQHDYVLAYDPVHNSWTRKADMPVASSHFEWSTVQVGRYILTISGMMGKDQFSDAVLAYDTVADRWTELEALPDAREGPAAGVYRGRILFTGGYSSERGLTRTTFWGTISV